MLSHAATCCRPEVVTDELLDRPRSLYSAVKFRLVAREIRRYSRRSGNRTPRVLDVGCGDRLALRSLEDEGLSFDYCGLDAEPSFEPELVGDARELEALRDRLPWRPEVVLLLDVLEHLEGRHHDVRRVLRGCASVLAEGGVLLVAVPQLYRLDRLKLRHLYHPAHKIRLTFPEWLALVEEELVVESTQGVGYLAALPYLAMLPSAYADSNALGRVFHLLRGTVCEWKPLEEADTWLSNTVGRVDALKGWANDALIVCRPR